MRNWLPFAVSIVGLAGPIARENEKAAWCKIRTCCQENSFQSCADCTRFGDLHECGTFNNMISKVFAFLFRSDRFACIQEIKDKGYSKYARFMADLGYQSIKR